MKQTKHLKKALLPTILFATPLIAFAQPTSFRDLVQLFLGILGIMVPVIIALTVAVILWSGAKTILQTDNPTKLAEGKSALVWGIVVLVIMVGVWGFVAILRNTFFL